MRLRRINIGRLGWSGMVYRCLVIGCDAVFFWLGVKMCLERYEPVGTALILNVVTMALYYLYHYWFLRRFRMGREPDGGG